MKQEGRPVEMWGRLVTCGGLVIRDCSESEIFNGPISNRPQVTNLPHIVGIAKASRRISTPQTPSVRATWLMG